MGRKRLISDIQAADKRLSGQRSLLQAGLKGRLDWLGSLPVSWRLGAGFVAGVLVQRVVMLLPLQRSRTLLMTGFQLWPALLRGLRAGAH